MEQKAHHTRGTANEDYGVWLCKEYAGIAAFVEIKLGADAFGGATGGCPRQPKDWGKKQSQTSV
jgi:hypothetical protein